MAIPIDLQTLISPITRVVFGGFKLLYNWATKPKLSVAAKAEGPFISHTTFNLPNMNAVQAIGQNPVDYFRIRVRNDGVKQAQGCRVQIVGVSFVEHGVWREVDPWEPVTLKWSLVGVPSIDISPDETRFCDVGHVVSNYIQNNVYRPTARRRLGQADANHHALFYLECEAIPNRQAGAIAHGDYCLNLKLLSSNLGTMNFGLYLRFMGQFATIAQDIAEGTIFDTPTKCPEVATVFRARD